MGIELKGTAYKPTETDTSRLLPMKEANEPFIFVHYPGNWVHDDEAGWVPAPSKLNAQPGVNGIGRDRKIGPAMPMVIEKQGIVISTNDARLGEWTDYVVSYECIGNGKAYACKWQRVTSLGGGVVYWEPSKPAWLSFRKHLRDSGIVPPMDRAFLSRLVVRVDDRINRMITRGSEKLGAAENLAALKAKRDKMIEDFERQFGTPKATPAADATPAKKITPKPKAESPMEAT